MLVTDKIIPIITSAGRWIVIGYKIGDHDITISDLQSVVSDWKYETTEYIIDHSVDIRAFLTPNGNRALCIMLDNSNYYSITYVIQRPLSRALKDIDGEASTELVGTMCVDGVLVDRKNALHQMVIHLGSSFLKYLCEDGCRDIFDKAYIEAMTAAGDGDYLAEYLPTEEDIFEIYNKLRKRASYGVIKSVR